MVGEDDDPDPEAAPDGQVSGTASDVSQPDEQAAATSSGSPALQLAGSVIAPGVATYRRFKLLGIGLMLLGCGAPVALLAWAYSRRDDVIGFALDGAVLWAVVAVCVVFALTRAVAVAEVARAFRGTPRIGMKTGLAALAVVVVALPALAVAREADQTRSAVDEAFSGGSSDALFDPDDADPPLTDNEAESDIDAESDTGDDAGSDGEVDSEGEPDDDQGDRGDTDGDDEPAVAGRDVVRTTLLLGSDAGPGRWGARTDSMILFSVHEASGRTSLISIPRNLQRLRFPPGSPMEQIFPDGFTAHQALANAIFTYVTTHSDLVEAYGGGDVQPQVVALAQGIGYSLDVKIDDFVLVNMEGFRDVIDAVGGVTIDVDKKVLLQTHNPLSKYEVPDSVGPGRVDMDGTLAIAFVRARRGDSDYFRMGRQRQVLAALGSQVSTTDAVKAFPKISDVLGDSLRTSLTAGEFSDLLDFLGERAEIGESIGLAPPLITPSRPDFPFIQTVVDDVQRYLRTGVPSGYSE